jgi:hypothetical protein|tara:strand:+ start:21 stop:476 length:456 start_codon:yes stop_codon:yes gene_type:complete
MTTTLTAADMTVTLTEAISLNGYDQGSQNTLTIADIAEINKRIVTCPTSEKTIISFAGAIDAGTFIDVDARYVRITNKDDTNFVKINIEGEASTDYTIRLDAGASHVILSTSTTGLADYADITGSTLENLSAIKATADTAACDLEIFVASV